MKDRTWLLNSQVALRNYGIQTARLAWTLPFHRLIAERKKGKFRNNRWLGLERLKADFSDDVLVCGQGGLDSLVTFG